MTADIPRFPHFRKIRLEDRPFIHEHLWKYQPEISELTFTNLFIWQDHYHAEWAVHENWLLFLDQDREGRFLLPPVGPAPRLPVSSLAMDHFKGHETISARIDRADPALATEASADGGYSVVPMRDHFDYVYRTSDLIDLPGRKYHGKRNHIAGIERTAAYTYADLTHDYSRACMDMADKWCRIRRCDEDLNLVHESSAIKKALTHYRELGVRGGAILLDGVVQAFALGEMLNTGTAVIHIEKADPENPDLYALINQRFCENAWRGAEFVNREQDLGIPGLRKAKESYHPVRMVEKYRISRK